MGHEPMRVGKDSTEPVDPITWLTPTETIWLDQAEKHVEYLNKLLTERGATPRFEIHRVRP
jgi:hypothetical protein